MPYESSKDETLAEETIERGDYLLKVSLYSYDGAKPKLQLSRILLKDGREQFAKLGRLTIEDVESIIPAMKKVISREGRQKTLEIEENREDFEDIAEVGISETDEQEIEKNSDVHRGVSGPNIL